MAEFLYIDRDLFQVAAQSSPSPTCWKLERKDVQAWVGTLPANEKDELLTNLIIDMDRGAVAELLQKFLKERSASQTDAAPPRRTVGELVRAAEASAAERRRIEVEKRAKEKARRERETALAREKHLDSLTGREPKLWAEIETLIATKQPKKYDEAIKLLADLRDLDARTKSGDFRMRIEALRQAHARKPTLIERLKKADL
jgi:FtsZ-interacting cell division protein YlmF